MICNVPELFSIDESSTVTSNPVLSARADPVFNWTADPATLLLVVNCDNLLSAIEPANISFVTPAAFIRNWSLFTSNDESSTLTSSVFPLLLNAFPAIIDPAPENWLNVNAVVPNVILPLLVNTNPALAFVVPFSTKVKAPPVTSVFASKSVALVGAPLAFTV